MIDIKIADITLREKSETMSFKEKIETARQLDRLCVGVIETAPISNGKTDVLFLHTIAPIIKNSVISCPTGLDEAEVDAAYDAIRSAAKPRLNIMVPVSTVQMEYISHLKPAKLLERMEAVVRHAASVCADVEVSLLDSTRAEKEFLAKAVRCAAECGAKCVTLCDTAGIMLPAEFEEYIKGVRASVPELENCVLSVECSNELRMAVACAVSCIECGVTQIKTVIDSPKCPSLSSIAKVFKEKADILGISTGLNMTVLENSVKQLCRTANAEVSVNEVACVTSEGNGDAIKLKAGDDIKTVAAVVEGLGYELSEEDMAAVYDEFVKLAEKKSVDATELDAIVASTAMQVAPTYKLKSYVINSGNIITPTVSLELIRGGESVHGFCIGDGPIDASFMAIEQITGHHYELDDFRIQSVTHGREALGESVVRLRHGGKLFSGKGTSTDIVGASINAYINALNKICFEEEM